MNIARTLAFDRLDGAAGCRHGRAGAGAATAAAIAQHDLFRHQRWAGQGRRPRWARGCRPALSAARAGGRCRRQDLACLPQHQRGGAGRAGQCARSYRPRPLAELQGRGRGAERRRPAQRQQQARHAELAHRARHHGGRRRLYAELSRHSDRLDHGRPRVPRQPQPDLQQLDQQHLRQRHGRPHRPARSRRIPFSRSPGTRRTCRAAARQDDLRATGGNGFFYCFAQ